MQIDSVTPNVPDKSKYVKGNSDQLICIDEVSSEDRYAHGPYKCLGCNHIMVPALGKQRSHHFKHKSGRPINCLNETYLHELAKRSIFSAISNAIRNGHPYHFKQLAPAECDYFEREFGFTCKGRRLPAQIDLTKSFDQVSMESGAKGYIADVLLSSSITHDVFAIEIAVTHQCETEKIESGLKIIEINVRAENEIEKFHTEIDTIRSNVATYNLKPLEVVKLRCTEPCHTTVLLLLLYSDGKAWYAEQPLARIREVTSDLRLVTWELVDFAGSGEVRNERSILLCVKKFMIRQKFELGRNVKSCLLCHHNGGLMNKHDVYCEKRGTPVWFSSSASTCDAYLPVQDVNQAKVFLGVS